MAYVKVRIGSMEAQVEDINQLPVSISYSLEDAQNFTQKTSSNALNLTIPASLVNDQVANTYRNPSIADMTSDKVFTGNQPCLIEANGYEILNGKAFLVNATHNDKPIDYTFNLFGDNATWLIDLKESTLYDFVQQVTFPFNRQSIMDSWQYNGMDENLPYVFAPVRYRDPFDEGPTSLQDSTVVKDYVVRAGLMRPSISVYWIIFWAFKSLGYRVQSDFMDTSYFRRLVMPWTWGSFLSSEGSKFDNHRVEAKSADIFYWSHSYDNYADLNVTKILHDNNGDYLYNFTDRQMEWHYNSPDLGLVEAHFVMQLNVDSTAHWGSSTVIEITWARIDQSGTMLDKQVERVTDIHGHIYGQQDDRNIKTSNYKATVSHNEKIICKVYLWQHESVTGKVYTSLEVLFFKTDFFKSQLGSTIDLSNYLSLKNYKFLDYFAGVVDAFNLSFNTDSVNKVVYIEPTHGYSLTDDLTQKNQGYFKDDFVSWDGKEDLSQKWILANFSDYEKELTFKFKDDSADGILKLLQDRNTNVLASGKYVFPDRFKTGKKEIENRFFSPTIHYNVNQWKDITGVTPQIVCIIPENVSNTSQSESENTFKPKLCYYKGNVSGAGGFVFSDGADYYSIFNTFPLMFSVNYMEGGENDPILSYSDEKIKSGSGSTIGKGLIKRFYWPRLAVMRNGQYYTCWFRLKLKDVAANILHREYISYLGNRWQLIKIDNFKPLQNLSTSCLLQKWAPVEAYDYNNTFPSENAVNGLSATTKEDIIYAQLLALPTDIPTT